MIVTYVTVNTAAAFSCASPTCNEVSVHTTLAKRPFSFSTAGTRVRTAAVALLSLALVAGGALVATPASAAETGRISGVVTSLATGETLADVEVSLYPAFDPLTESYDSIDSEMTDAGGAYSFTRVPAGSYRIGFTDYSGWDYDPDTGEDIAPETSHLSQFHGGAPGDTSGEVEALSFDGSSILVDEALTVAAKYTGKIVNPDGKPAAGVYVLALSDGDTDDWYEMGVTAKNGTFSIGGLAYGKYTIITEPTDTSPSTVTQAPASTPTTPTTALPTIKLTKGAFFTGRLLDANGKPAKNAGVGVENTNHDFVDYFGGMGSETNSKGQFKVGPLTPGTYAPYAYTDGESPYVLQFLGGSRDVFLSRTVSVKAGATVTREFRMAATTILSGVVLDSAGKRLANTDVQTYQLDGTGSIDRSYSSQTYTTTNAKGQYSIKNINPGSYITEFGYLPSKSGAATTKTHTIKAGTTTIHGQLGAVSLISGIVRSSDGKPVKGITVEAVPVNLDECPITLGVDWNDEEEPVTTSATGAYTIVVPAGQWALKFTDPAGRVTGGYLGGGSYPTDPQTTVVTAPKKNSTIAARDVTLSTAGTRLTAEIVTSNGALDAIGTTTIERLIDGEVVDGPGFGSCSSMSYFDFEDVIEDDFPTDRLSDGEYRLTVEPVVQSGSYDVDATVIDFSIENSVLSVVNGEPAQSTNSFGTIALEAPVASTANPQIAPPTIFAPDGVAVGSTLTAVVDYAGLDTDWSEYQWYRDGRPIAGATVEGYVVQAGDVGSLITVEVAGYDGTDFFGPLRSLPTAVVSDAVVTVPEDAPKISGSGRIDSPLTAVPNPGDPKGTTYGYQWSVNGLELPAVTTKTFTPRIQDLQETVTVTVNKTLPGAAVTTGATSAGVVIKKAKAIVLKTPVLLVNGNAKGKLYLGSTLTASIKGLPKDSVGVMYQWQLNKGKGWVAVPGATSSSLTLSKKKSSTTGVGYRYRLIVDVERSGYDDTKAVASNALKSYKKK